MKIKIEKNNEPKKKPVYTFKGWGHFVWCLFDLFFRFLWWAGLITMFAMGIVGVVGTIPINFGGSVTMIVLGGLFGVLPTLWKLWWDWSDY